MTDDLRPGACPGDEQLAAYAEGLLSEEERLAVERHLAECETCREVVAEAVRLRELDLPFVTSTTVKPAVVDDSFRRRRALKIRSGVLALAASLLLVVLVRPELNPFRRPTPLEELVAVVGTSRTVEARLTGGFQHGPLRSPTRSGERVRESDYALLAAVADIFRRAENTSDSRAVHAAAIARLQLGERSEAVDLLTKAAEADPGNGHYPSDLAAAYLDRAKYEGDGEDYARALAAAEKATRLDPTLPEARFNRALALEALGLHEAARAAWNEYLELDPSGDWADEARSHLSAIAQDEEA